MYKGWGWRRWWRWCRQPYARREGRWNRLLHGIRVATARIMLQRSHLVEYQYTICSVLSSACSICSENSSLDQNCWEASLVGPRAFPDMHHSRKVRPGRHDEWFPWSNCILDEACVVLTRVTSHVVIFLSCTGASLLRLLESPLTWVYTGAQGAEVPFPSFLWTRSGLSAALALDMVSLPHFRDTWTDQSDPQLFIQAVTTPPFGRHQHNLLCAIHMNNFQRLRHPH